MHTYNSKANYHDFIDPYHEQAYKKNLFKFNWCKYKLLVDLELTFSEVLPRFSEV